MYPFGVGIKPALRAILRGLRAERNAETEALEDAAEDVPEFEEFGLPSDTVVQILDATRRNPSAFSDPSYARNVASTVFVAADPSEEEVREHQRRLVDAGYLQEGSFEWGEPGQATFEAYTNAFQSMYEAAVRLDEQGQLERFLREGVAEQEQAPTEERSRETRQGTPAPPPQPSGQEYSPELQQVLSKYPEAAAQIQAMGGPVVYLGQEPPRTSSQTGGSEPLGEQTGTIDQLLRRLFVMADENPDRLRDLQQRLHRGGFYGSTPAGRIGWGTPDEATVRAYRTALERAASFYQAGIRKTPDEVIDAAARAAEDAETLGLARDTGVVGGGNVYTINLADPAALREFTDRVAKTIIGRKPSAEVRDRIVEAVRSEQAAQQQAIISARESQARTTFDARTGAADGGGSRLLPSQTVESSGVDPQARVTEGLRREHPVEASATDIANSYGDFLEVIFGIGRN